MESSAEAWIWGRDTLSAIVGLWVSSDGVAHLWRRPDRSAPVKHETDTFRPWALLPSLSDIVHLGERLQPVEKAPTAPFTYRLLHGPGTLRYLVTAQHARALEEALLLGAGQRIGKTITRLNALEPDDVIWLPLDEQYLMTTGRTYFKDISYDTPLRLQCDLETTGLDPFTDSIFLIAIRSNRGDDRILEIQKTSDGWDERDLLRRLAATLAEIDPDVIENHNLLGFDLPFIARRAAILRQRLVLGRIPAIALDPPPIMREDEESGDIEEGPRQNTRRWHPRIPGREVIDTLTAVRRHDFVVRDMPSHSLKDAARYFGVAPPDRTYLEGSKVYATWQEDPATVRRYARDDVIEAAAVARLLGGAAFALAQMAPRRYERVAEAGPATGILDPLLMRAYLHSGEALPGYAVGDGTMHTGAALYLFATGVAERIIKADVASLYPSLMRQYQIGPRGDHLQVLLSLVDHLVTRRLAAKAIARAAVPGSEEYQRAETLSAAFKILVNSAYGYCGAVGLTRFADVHAANAITRHGREILQQLCQAFAARGATLIEADTDGVYIAVPADWDEEAERQIVAEVGKTLPPLITLAFEGRYAAMFSHETKNYALLTYDGRVHLRGVAFRSIRYEPFGQAFLREAVQLLLNGAIAELRDLYQTTIGHIRARDWPAREFAVRAKLRKHPADYLKQRAARREGPYEAMIRSGRSSWRVGTIVHFYRTANGYQLLEGHADARDYDVSWYLDLFRQTFVSRLERAFDAEAFTVLFAPNGQASLFSPPIASLRPILRQIVVTT